WAQALCEAYYVPESAENQHRKAVSLDAVADHSPVGSRQHYCWPASSMPVAVTTNQPQYPPPKDRPRLLAFHHSTLPRRVLLGPASHRAQRCPGSCHLTIHTEKYPLCSTLHLIYRCISKIPRFQAPVETAPTVPSVIGIGRAPDGTVVQGRFPHRQSGHGTSLARQLDDHPFHNNNALPTASISQASLDSFRTGLDFAPGTPSKGFGSVPRTGRRRGLASPWVFLDGRLLQLLLLSKGHSKKKLPPVRYPLCNSRSLDMISFEHLPIAGQRTEC
ncbi:hypothetical protein N7454_000605, partial [Penicillium verhagenii]